MKRFLTLFIGLFASGALLAQSYVIGTSTGSGTDYDYDTPGTTVLSIPATQVLSSTQTLPFPFDFFGSPVSSYKVSDNGYITFDAGATTSDPNNTTVPNASGPNNAIYAFWDDLNVISGSGSVDEVVSWTYGTAPNRVHVIQWYSVTPAAGSGFIYAAIRIYECGTFDVVNGFANNSGLSGTIGAENASGTVGVQVSGSPSLTHATNNADGNDDIVYSFYWEGNNYDIGVSSLGFTGGSVGIGNNNVNGVITNYGGQAITSLDLHYTVNGGTAVTDNITGINIAANGGTYNFSHSTPWNVAAGGQNYTLCVYADNLNGGQTDQVNCNDEMCTDLFSRNGTSGTKRVVIEEFSGAWCQFCPDGTVVLDNIVNSNPGMVFGVTVHDGDAMEFNEGIRTNFNVTAYPNGQVDRYQFSGEPKVPHSRGAWAANTSTRLGAYTPANVTVSSVYNSSTRQVEATVTANFVDYAAGDMRLVLELLEDSLVGSGTGWDQVNYYNTQSGHPYFGAGNPIVGFVHNQVLRSYTGWNAMGNSGIVPSTTSPGDSYSENFVFTLPGSYNEDNIKLVGFLYSYSSDVLEGEILNADEAPLGVATTVEEEINDNYITVAPNPVRDFGFINAHFSELTEATFEMYNAFGQKVSTIRQGSYAPGKHSVYFDTQELANGVYIISVKTPEQSFTKKIVVAH